MKTALITGASRGIGASITRQLAIDGFYVFINYHHQVEKAQTLLDQIVQAGGQGELCPFDVSQAEQVETTLEGLQKKHGPLHVLVNNAGITIDSLLIRLKPQDLNRTLDIDLKGAIYCTQAACKFMMKARSGSIIQISSVVGECGNPGQSAYAAAKAGLIGFAKSVAKEFASRSIRVNVVTPGFIATDMTDALTDPQKQAILGTIPMQRLGNPEEVAALVSFLASPASQYITGQVIGISGGMYM